MTLPAAQAQLPDHLPPEIRARLEAQMEAARRASGAGNVKAASGASAAQTNDPAKLRLKLLKQIKIDRTNAGILQSRLKEAQRQEKQPVAEKPAAEQTPAQVEIAQIKKDIEQFGIHLNLGEWQEAGKYLASLKENEAKVAYDRILQQLAASVYVQPRPELAAAGARPHKQQQYLRATDVLAIVDMCPSMPDDATLKKLSSLLANCPSPPKAFFQALQNTSRYFGKKDAKTSLLTAKFLLDADHLKESKPYLPELAMAQKENDYTALNLIARWHAQAHREDMGETHLPVAWQVSLDLVGNKKAPYNERAEALYRALGLVPSLEGETGREWLHKTFANTDGEGFEILTTIGTLAAQIRQHPSPEYRLEQIKMQRAAAQALLGTPGIDPKPWKEILTLYARNWLYEANHSNRYDTSTSMRPRVSFDSFGNPYYIRSSGRTMPPVSGQRKRMPPINTGDLLRERPDGKWMSMIDEPVRIQVFAFSTRLYLKVKEHQKAFPLLESLASANPEEAKDLAREMIRVWAENNNPNQKQQYRSSYYYFSGYNQRAQTIPLTRSKQERNLQDLAELIQKIRNLKLGETFDKEFSDAFIQCHSQAEVWRVESLETVFGSLDQLDAKTAASLLRRMRGNLANLWPNPKLQEQAKTKRKDKELQAQILKGYDAARGLCLNVLNRHPDDWALQIQLASLGYEESNYRASLGSHPEHSANKRQALDALAKACANYISQLPLKDKKDESDEPFTTWFYAALGSPDLGALKSHHQPVPSELPKIKKAFGSLPGVCQKRHMETFAKTLNTRLANVSADLKYRFLESALPITGEHERIAEATKIFQYYQDLVTEIQLHVRIDGSDRINASEPFGLFVNLRHTREIERESGGFQRYLINQNNSPYSYNYGRPTEDYRDKFEKSARAALEEHFEVVSLTFHHSKVQSRTDQELGWSVTPYAYFLLKPKGPEVDSIPPLKIDLDFLDTSGYVVLPITSAAIPIDASGEGQARPHRNLKMTLTLDERKADKENTLALEIKASAHGLIPSLEQMLDLELEGYDVEIAEDNELLIAELDAGTDDGAPVSTREWMLTLTPQSGQLPAQFTFPALRQGLSLAKEDALILQKYDDVDLVPVTETVALGAGSSGALKAWHLLLGLPVIALALWLIMKAKNQPVEEMQAGPELPQKLTPVTAIAFLKRIHRDAELDDAQKTQLLTEINQLEAQAFGPENQPPTTEFLKEVTSQWQSAATVRRAA